MNNDNKFGAIMAELSKTFEYLHYKLWKAKIDVNDFDLKQIRLVQKHFSNRKQRVKMSDGYNAGKNICHSIS